MEIINILIIGLLIIYLDMSGLIVNKKLRLKTTNTIVIGFLLFLSFSEVVLLPMIILNITFYKMVAVYMTLFILFNILIIYASKISINFFKEYIDTFKKKKIMVFSIGSILGIVVAILSQNSSDSWLYVPMVLDPVYNNELYYAVNTMHEYDTYYKLLSILTFFSVKNSFVFIMYWYKFFEAFLIINTFDFFSELIFKNKKKEAFIIMVIALISFNSIFLPSFSNDEINWFLWMTSPTGTLILASLITPLFFWWIYNKGQSQLLLWILVLAGLALSSSTLYIYATFLFLNTLYKLIFHSKYLKIELIKSLDVSFPIILLLILYVFPEQLKSLAVFFSTIFFVVYMINKKKIKTLYYKLFSLVIILGYVGIQLTSFVINLFKYDSNIIQYVSMFFLAPKDDKFLFTTPYSYPSYNTDIYLVIFIILGLMYTYKKRRDIFVAVLMTIIFAANNFWFWGIGTIYSVAVYHRVYILTGIGFITIFGLINLFEYLKVKISQKAIFIFFTIFSIMTFTMYHYDFHFYKFNESIYSYKINDDNVDELMNISFSESKEVYTGFSKRTNKGINQIFQLDPNLKLVEECEENCYIVQSKFGVNGPIDRTSIEIVVETNDYYVIYK